MRMSGPLEKCRKRVRFPAMMASRGANRHLFRINHGTSFHSASHADETAAGLSIDPLAPRPIIFTLRQIQTDVFWRKCRCSSGVERTLGKGEVEGSIPSSGFPDLEDPERGLTPEQVGFVQNRGGRG